LIDCTRNICQSSKLQASVPAADTATNGTFVVTVNNPGSPSGGFTGSVALTAAITSSPAGAKYLPTLSFGSPPQ
jgi:hypothetical protein